MSRKFKIISLAMVFFVSMLSFPSGLFSLPEQNNQDIYSYAEDIADNISSDDMIESIEDSPIFEDAVTNTNEYIDYKFSIDKIVDPSADTKTSKDEDGYNYTISTKEDAGGSRTVIMVSDKDDSITEIFFDPNDENMSLTKYEPIEANSNAYSISTVELDLSEAVVPDTNPVRIAGISWKTKTALKVDSWLSNCGNYWYQRGVEGSGKKAKDYLKIGCSATYTIRTDNLSASKVSNCNSYVSNISSSNKYYDAAGLASVSNAVLAVIFVCIVASFATMGISALIGMIIALVGGLTVTVTNLVYSARDAYDAKDLYSIIKKYA